MGKRKLVWLGSYVLRILQEIEEGDCSNDVSKWSYFEMLDHKYKIGLSERNIAALNNLERLAIHGIPNYTSVAAVEEGYEIIGMVKTFYLQELKKVSVSGEYGLEKDKVEKLVDAVKESGPVKIRRELKNKYF